MTDKKVEIHRLNTFFFWPSDAPINAARLAKGGFYSTGNSLETQCAWCNKKISDWTFGDNVMARHRRLDPLCPFVINPTESGNVPSNDSLAEKFNSPRQGNMKNEVCRLATFSNWPNAMVSKEALAKAGFYYTNRFDQVRCAWCRGVLENWLPEDVPIVEHKRHFPNCPRVQVGPGIESEELGIVELSPARHPKYVNPLTRIESFARWPISEIQRPEEMALAGFFYENIDDHVKCFHCNGGLRSWQKDDDPWVEHARWFPKCQFVKLAKGSQYIQNIKGSNPQIFRREMRERGLGRAMTIDEAMTTEPVRQALEIGLNEGRIRVETQLHLAQYGRPFDSTDSLIEKVLEGQATEGEDEPHQDSSIVQEVSRILENLSTAWDLLDEEEATSNGVQRQSNQENCLSVNETPIELPQNNSEHHSDTAQPTSSKSEEASKVAAPKEDNVPNEDVELQKQNLLEEENRKLRDARLCKICMDEEVRVVFLPCGHLVTCAQCATSMQTCPLCRSAIKGFVRTFFS